MTVTIVSERPDTPDAAGLIRELDAYLHPLYPHESQHGFSCEQLIAEEVAFFLLRCDGVAACCCGILMVGSQYGEIKRMYVRPNFRGLGYAKKMLCHLEDHARSQNVFLLRLETGVHQHEAMRLYEQIGYYRIPPFGPYFDDPLSLCYEKRLT